MRHNIMFLAILTITLCGCGSGGGGGGGGGTAPPVTPPSTVVTLSGVSFDTTNSANLLRHADSFAIDNGSYMLVGGGSQAGNNLTIAMSDGSVGTVPCKVVTLTITGQPATSYYFAVDNSADPSIYYLKQTGTTEDFDAGVGSAIRVFFPGTGTTWTGKTPLSLGASKACNVAYNTPEGTLGATHDLTVYCRYTVDPMDPAYVPAENQTRADWSWNRDNAVEYIEIGTTAYFELPAGAG